MRSLLLPLLAAFTWSVAGAQPLVSRSDWYPAGGTGISLQGPVGWEAHGAWLWSPGVDRRSGPLYQLGPELMLGAYFGTPFHWGQRLGVRQLILGREPDERGGELHQGGGRWTTRGASCKPESTCSAR